MRRRFLKGLVALLSVGGLSIASGRANGAGIMDPTPETQDDDQSGISAAFTLATLMERQAKGARPYLKFFENNTLRIRFDCG